MTAAEHSEPERRLLRRARLQITLQVAGAISLVLLLTGSLVYCVTVSGQDTAVRRELAAAAHQASVTAPPACVWLFEQRDGSVRASPGAPAALPLRAALDRVAAGPGPLVQQVQLAGHTYLVHTERRGDAVVQAAMDLRYQAADREPLLRALAIA